MLVTKTVVTREEILNTIKELAEKLGRPPSYAEMNRVIHVSGARITKLFGRWSAAVRECGLPGRKARSWTAQELFEDYCRVVRKLGQTPRAADYERHGKFSSRPFRRRFRQWSMVAPGILEHAAKKGLMAESADVVEILNREADGLETPKRTSAQQEKAGSTSAKWTGRPLYGRPLLLPAMAAAPTNEAGVLFLFGAVAERLGYTILRVQSAFPDIEALRKISEDHTQRVKAELEYESKNFVMHNHEPEGCDLIVCWRHNWPECPLEVLELEKIVAELTGPARQR